MNVDDSVRMALSEAPRPASVGSVSEVTAELGSLAGADASGGAPIGPPPSCRPTLSPCFKCEYDVTEGRYVIREPKVVVLGQAAPVEPEDPGALRKNVTYVCAVTLRDGKVEAAIVGEGEVPGDALVSVPICRIDDRGFDVITQYHVGAIVVGGSAAAGCDEHSVSQKFGGSGEQAQDDTGVFYLDGFGRFTHFPDGTVMGTYDPPGTVTVDLDAEDPSSDVPAFLMRSGNTAEVDANQLSYARLKFVGGAKGRPGRFDVSVSEDPVSGERTASFSNPYYDVGGKTYVADVQPVPIPGACIVALRVAATGSQSETGIVTYTDLGALRNAQDDLAYYISPLYEFGPDGTVVCDFRTGPVIAMGEF